MGIGAGIDGKIKLVEQVIEGTDDVPELPLRGRGR
jgi:hypothetical protein